MASCPSSPSWKRCALLKSRFSQIRLKRVNKGLQPCTSHIFGESDEPNSQEISRFIKITFRDRGRSIFCYIGFQDIQISIFGGVTEETRKSKGRNPTSSESPPLPRDRRSTSEIVISLFIVKDSHYCLVFVHSWSKLFSK